MKQAKDMTTEEYAVAKRAAERGRTKETGEPKPVSKMTPEEYRAAKKAAGIHR